MQKRSRITSAVVQKYPQQQPERSGSYSTEFNQTESVKNLVNRKQIASAGRFRKPPKPQVQSHAQIDTLSIRSSENPLTNTLGKG